MNSLEQGGAYETNEKKSEEHIVGLNEQEQSLLVNERANAKLAELSRAIDTYRETKHPSSLDI